MKCHVPRESETKERDHLLVGGTHRLLSQEYSFQCQSLSCIIPVDLLPGKPYLLRETFIRTPGLVRTNEQIVGFRNKRVTEKEFRGFRHVVSIVKMVVGLVLKRFRRVHLGKVDDRVIRHVTASVCQIVRTRETIKEEKEVVNVDLQSTEFVYNKVVLH